jgi:uncharacterized damage-inducible protein DinB
VEWYRFGMELNPYAKYLAGEDPIPVLFTTVGRLQTLVAPLSMERLIATPTPGKWSIGEIVSHLADTELVFAFRLRQTLAQEHAIIEPFDQNVWAERYDAYDFASALAMFTATRNWNLKLLGSMTEADKHKPTTHPERGTMTFWTLIETMAGHDIDHLEQLERLAASE